MLRTRQSTLSAVKRSLAAQRTFHSSRPASAEITLEVDGKTVSIEQGSSLIQACEKAGKLSPLAPLLRPPRPSDTSGELPVDGLWTGPHWLNPPRPRASTPDAPPQLSKPPRPRRDYTIELARPGGARRGPGELGPSRRGSPGAPEVDRSACLRSAPRGPVCGRGSRTLGFALWLQLHEIGGRAPGGRSSRSGTGSVGASLLSPEHQPERDLKERYRVWIEA